jgi:hypothetical protein
VRVAKTIIVLIHKALEEEVIVTSPGETYSMSKFEAALKVDAYRMVRRRPQTRE